MRDGEPLVVIRPVSTAAAKQERRRSEHEARQREILNSCADELGAQVLEGLEYQTEMSIRDLRRMKKKSRKQQ